MNPNDYLESVILVSTPWPLFNRPSVQLGVLKSYLRSKFNDLRVEASHFYLKVANAIGYKAYQTISERVWLAEIFYAAMLFPEQTAVIEKLFYRETVGKPFLRKKGFLRLVADIQDVTEEFIENTEWHNFGLAGFSVCLCQTMSSLYIIRQIKKKFPYLPIVAGGSAFCKESAQDFLRAFPEINFIIIGEGELTLSELVNHLRKSHGMQNDEKIGTSHFYHSSLITHNSSINHQSSFSQLTDLKALPAPDYDEYFHMVSSLDSKNVFFPTMPVEISRGCWWRSKKRINLEHRSKFNGCAFCNLNLQWDGYRSKSPSQISAEINYLSTKYRILSIAFMDNVLPISQIKEIFNQIKGLNKDLHMFGEIRATTPRQVLATMKDAGMDKVQIGIEALSTSLLQKLNKGTTAIQNIEIMRNCQELGIINNSNLIFRFPGSDEADVAETLRNLEFVLPFRPLRPVYFWLGRRSPVWENPESFGIRSIYNHPNYKIIFPSEIAKSMRLMVQSYSGDMSRQKKLWKPVMDKVREWKKAYAALNKTDVPEPVIGFQDGKDFLIIRQRLLNAEPMMHRIAGTSRLIYLFCRKTRSIRTIVKQFPIISEDKIISFLRMMKDKKLMFEENEKFLSLAMRLKS